MIWQWIRVTNGLMERGLQHSGDLCGVLRCLRNPTRRATRSKRRNLAHRTTMQAALSHVTATCNVRARAQIAIMGFRFPSLKAIAIPQIVSHYRSNFLLSTTTRGSPIEFRLRKLAFAGRKIGLGSRRDEENEIFLTFFSSRQKKISPSRLDEALHIAK